MSMIIRCFNYNGGNDDNEMKGEYVLYKDHEKAMADVDKEIDFRQNIIREKEAYIRELEAQIEKMKCCGNCVYAEAVGTGPHAFDSTTIWCHLKEVKYGGLTDKCDRWESEK